MCPCEAITIPSASLYVGSQCLLIGRTVQSDCSLDQCIVLSVCTGKATRDRSLCFPECSAYRQKDTGSPAFLVRSSQGASMNSFGHPISLPVSRI